MANRMSRHRLYHFHPQLLRNSLNRAKNLSEEIHRLEDELIQQLVLIDQDKFYVRYGHNSLRGFCIDGLNFTRTQSQRIATLVRRSEPVVNIEHQGYSPTPQ